MAWLGLDYEQLDLLTKLNDDSDTFEPVIIYLRGLVNET